MADNTERASGYILIATVAIALISIVAPGFGGGYALGSVASGQAQAPPNGFAAIQSAADLARQSKLYEQAVSAKVTLTVKRAALRDPSIARALKQLRAALDMPVAALRDANGDPPFQMYSAFRSLGRLIAVEAYVELADGKTDDAVGALRDGMRLSHMLQSDLVIGDLTGLAVQSLLAKTMDAHLGQLPARSCERLLSLVDEWMQAPNPHVRAMVSERDFALVKLREQLGAQNPGLFRAAVELIKARYDLRAAGLQLPLWERSPLPELGDSDAERYYKALGTDDVFANYGNAIARTQADVQILGVSAAIQRYLWEYDSLPQNLEALKLGAMAQDPFTGKPLVYNRTGPRTYSLTCDGAEEFKRQQRGQ
jgi:hypothetical protein